MAERVRMASRQDDLHTMIEQELSGWHLPSDDQYFSTFAAGPPPKRNGFYREHLVEALKYVRVWEVAIDVGSHVGFWTVDLAQQFTTVYAFEPAEVTFECLLKNTEEYDNVRAFNLAVGDKPGKCAIQNDKQRPGNSGSNYIKPGSGEITIVTLDEFGFEACDFLKIDVEGYELRALEGAAKLIKKHRPVISMECTDRKFLPRYGIPEGEAQRWLLKRGYREAWAKSPDKVFVPA